jgi:hypothetical protein
MENLDMFMEPVTPALAKLHINAVVSHHGKNEKLAWKRRVKKMMGLIDEMKVVDEQILELSRSKQPTIDEVALLRSEMVKECIHPRDHLVHAGTFLLCKFCERRISIPRILPLEVEDSETNEGDDNE